MANEFLSSLCQVPYDELPDSTCIICKEEYRAWASAPANGDLSLSSWEVSHLSHLGGTEDSDQDSTYRAAGSGEQALRLPCGHVFGDECINVWLSPSWLGGSGRNTCPCCRRVLFVHPMEDKDEEDDDDDGLTAEEVEEQELQSVVEDQRYLWYSDWHCYALPLLRANGDAQIERQWRAYWDEWWAALTTLNEQSFACAREAQTLFLRETGFTELPVDYRVEYFFISSTTDYRPMVSAIQTLRFREHRLCVNLGLIDFVEHFQHSPVAQISPEMEDSLFQRLEREGAFRNVLEHVVCCRARWEILRRVGFVWDGGHHWTGFAYDTFPSHFPYTIPDTATRTGSNR